MTLTLELTPEEEERLREEAARRGVDVETALRAVIGDLPETAEMAKGVPSENGPTWGAKVLARWKAKGSTPIWQDLPEDGPELAAKFQRMAEQPGPLPCD